MEVHPYLSFEGRCEEALEFYRAALDAKVDMLMRFEESPDRAQHGQLPPGTERKVLHASFLIGDSMLMASDGRCTGQARFGGIALSLTTADDAEAAKRFAALADGGEVRMPLAKTFFASSFGMVVDRFGIEWMVVTPTE
ncbi:MAG TPA: VOC family protein [Myxococcota bacterium]|nr:VOC family protein [Myxococcota bacterium]